MNWFRKRKAHRATYRVGRVYALCKCGYSSPWDPEIRQHLKGVKK